MRLYTLDHSPYSTRVRTQIRHKHLPIKFVRPPELRSKILKNTFPLGQLPVLELDDGELLGESTVILNYLEELFPDYPLRGQSAVEKARANMLVRWSDTHLAPTLAPVIRAAVISDCTAVEAFTESVRKELRKFDHLIVSQSDYRNRDLHIGDICAVVSLSYMQAIFELCNSRSLFDEFPLVVNWWLFSLQRNSALWQSVNEMLLAIVDWLPVAGKLTTYPDQGLLRRLTILEPIV